MKNLNTQLKSQSIKRHYKSTNQLRKGVCSCWTLGDDSNSSICGFRMNLLVVQVLVPCFFLTIDGKGFLAEEDLVNNNDDRKFLNFYEEEPKTVLWTESRISFPNDMLTTSSVGNRLEVRWFNLIFFLIQPFFLACNIFIRYLVNLLEIRHHNYLTISPSTPS